MIEMLERYEQKALVGMISNNEHRYNWANKLSVDHFTVFDNQRVFEIIINNKQMSESDLNFLLETESNKKNFDYSMVQELYEMEAFECQEETSIAEINRFKHFRDLKKKWENINPNNPLKEEIRALYDSLEDYDDKIEDIGNGMDAYMGVHQRMMDKTKNKRKRPTGFKPYDNAIGGISKGLHIIGARPNGGKTTYAIEVMLAHAKKYTSELTVFFSCEVGAEDLWYKIVSNNTRIPIEVLEKGTMTQAHTDYYDRSCKNIMEFEELSNFIYVASPIMNTLKADQIIKKLEKEKGKKVGLVGFDYLQIMQPIDNKYFNDTDKVQKTSNEMRIFATKYPTIALVQVNRDGDNEECPETKHIKSSSQIEQDASTILFLWWNDKAKCEMCSGLKKNRYGASEIFDQLKLDGPTGRINLARHETTEKQKKRTY